MTLQNRIMVAAVAIAGCIFAALAINKQGRGLRDHYAADIADRHGLKVATWNLQWFPGKNPKPTEAEAAAHFDAVVEAIWKLDADILCLQEIRELPGNSELARLAETTGYEIQTVSNFNYQQEVAILSRQPAIASFYENFEERGRDRNPPRGFAYAHFRPDGYPEIHLYSVHLKSNSGGIEKTTPKREEAARQLLAHADAVSGEGVVILTGDFNTDPTRPDWKGDGTLKILTDAGFRWTGDGVERGDLVSWLSDGRYPDAVFDHIMVRGDIEVSEAATVETGGEVSDHRAVWVQFRMLIPR